MNKSGRSAREILTSACGTPLRGARSFGSETPFTGEQSEALRGTDLVAVPSQQLAEEGPHSEPRLKGNIQDCVGDRKLNTTHQALRPSLLLQSAGARVPRTSPQYVCSPSTMGRPVRQRPGLRKVTVLAPEEGFLERSVGPAQFKGKCVILW